LTRAENAMDPTANADVLVEVSGILKAHAVTVIKICEDLRKLQLLGEIKIETLQAGSSIMPNKVNPVMLEAGIQVGLKTIANDLLVTEAAARGTLQICEFLPLAAVALLESLEMLARFNRAFARQVEAIKADESLCQKNFEQHPMLITAFLPHLGYDRASELARQFAASGEKNLRVYLEERLGKDFVSKTLSAQNLMSLGYENHE
jgi:aspartate ammonia-lyase